jgi:hypothetical protein
MVTAYTDKRTTLRGADAFNAALQSSPRTVEKGDCRIDYFLQSHARLHYCRDMNQIEVLKMVLIAQNPQEMGTEPKCLAQKTVG